MERITITIETGTPAFDRHPNREVVRIVHCAADLISQGRENWRLLDADGRTVGRITIKSKPLAKT
jgi:hypothetical protein